MARNTLSRAERYHPKGKQKQITTKQSPSLCDFLLHTMCRACPRSLTSWQKTWTGMRRRGGSKACFVSLITVLLIGFHFSGISRNELESKIWWASIELMQNGNGKVKTQASKQHRRKKHTTITIDFGKSLITIRHVDKTYWYCEELQTILRPVSTKTGSDKPP